MITEQTASVLRVYMTDLPRTLGLFHFAPARIEGAAKTRGFNRFGLIVHIGPCKCGDPTHKFPDYYSTTSCVFVRGFGHVLTVRIPWLVYDALRWIKGPS